MERSNQLSLPTSVPNVACDLDALFAAYYRRLTRLLYRVTGDTARAEEFASEAFWRLHDKPPRDDTNIEGWLYHTGLRLALDYLKKERRRARYESLAIFFGVTPDPQQAVEQQEKQAHVRRTLAALKPAQAAMLLLRSEGLSYAELAAALNLNAASVGTLLTRAGQAFKKEYVVANMEASLRQAGVNDQPIPKEWDGAQVSFTTRSAISAVWNNGEMSLMQHPPITFSTPAGFDFTVYWTGALRAAGVNREQARALAERMRTTPTILLGITSKNKKAIREVNLRAGPATLIETIGIPWSWKDDRALLIWSVADRIYHLEARSAEQAIAAANSITLEENAAVAPAGFAAGDKFPVGSYELFVEKEKRILTFTADGRIVGKKVGGARTSKGAIQPRATSL